MCSIQCGKKCFVVCLNEKKVAVSKKIAKKHEIPKSLHGRKTNSTEISSKENESEIF